MRMTATSDAATQAIELLTALVRVDSINPMGRPRSARYPVERKAIEVIEDWLTPYRHRLTLERQSCSPEHENLVIRLAGLSDRPVGLFEAHLDTVPADDWAERALCPVLDGEDLVGRGACDDKGSVVAMVLALTRLVETDTVPPRPIVLVCAGDEEYAQTGIKHFRTALREEIGYGIFGEPTRLHPVVQHKGTIRWDLTVHGASAHTSRPELGFNAVLGMVQVIAALGRYQEKLQREWRNPYMTGPLVTVTMIHGGRTRNATPDECTIAIDFRVLPDMNPDSEKNALIDYLSEVTDLRITHGANQLMTPPLNTNPASPFCERVLAACRQVAGDGIELRGAPYGTDAAWVSDLCPAVVLGPGDIASAHAVDERISIREVVDAAKIYQRIMLDLHTL